MQSNEKRVSYQSSNSYSTLNEIGSKTKNVWIVFHGMGFLSRYFLKFFEGLNANENYVIAPQAPSKYYMKDKFTHVGASWLTKENTIVETENVLSYVDAVFANEKIKDKHNIIVFGFSQGVSIAMRWVAQRKINCEQLVLYAGGIPKELDSIDFNFLYFSETKTTLIYGKDDEFLTEEKVANEIEKAKALFGNEVHVVPFDGGHEIKPEIIATLV